MKIVIVYGTRPELIKLAPLVLGIRNDHGHQLEVICTGQHKEMLMPLQQLFGIENDLNWQIMKDNQSLNYISSQVLKKMDQYLENNETDLVMVQGDTTTVLSAAMAAYHRGIKVAHVEAGLRSFDLKHPFPEEFNRKTVSIFADYNFAPTQNAANNLMKEGVKESKIHITGNTVIDALEILKSQLKSKTKNNFKTILVTAHRRENHGEGIRNICHAILKLVAKRSDIRFIWPVHPNPNVHTVVHNLLGSTKAVELLEPIDYLSLLEEMAASDLIWTDSGGIQEEAPSFKKPVLILREVTERPEILENGFGKLVNHNIELLVSETERILDSEDYYSKYISGENPFGDGKASRRIIDKISE